MPLEPILALLKAQEELRFFVDGTRNLGHQGATVSLLKQLIDKTGFTGRITLVYADPVKPAHGDTLGKLAYLLAGLDPAKIESTTVGYGTCKRIGFLRYAERGRLPGECAFGFTGGADDMSVNFARELKVRYFLRLQPYLWDDDASRKTDPYYESSRIEEPDDRYCFLADECPGFRSLPYRFPRNSIQTVSEEIWSWYSRRQTFDTALKACTANVEVIYQAYQEGRGLQLWPIYGLQHFGECIPDIALNLVLVALQVQPMLGRPIVAVVMSNPAQAPRIQDLVWPFARDLAVRVARLPRFEAALARRTRGEAGRRRAAAVAAAIAKQMGPWFKTGARLTVFSDYDPTHETHVDISDALGAVLGRAGYDDVIFVFTGLVPVDVYNYFYANCSIPGVFEGQASSSLVVSLGRPFLQIPRAGHAIENSYPSRLAGRDFTPLATVLNDTARQLRESSCTRYLTGDGAGDPDQLLEQLSKVADFIVQAQDPASEVRAFFEAMREHFQQDVHDKLSVALAALQARVGFG